MSHARIPYAAIFCLAAAIGACGKSSPSAPSASSSTSSSSAGSRSSGSAVITGTVSGGTGVAAGLMRSISGSTTTISVVGSSSTSVVSGNGSFSLQNVPSGHVELEISGPGMNGRVSLDDVAEREEIRLKIRVSGAAAEIEENHRERPDHQVEVEGIVAATPSPSTLPSTLLVGDVTVAVPANTPIRRDGSSVSFASIRKGDRVHVHAMDNGGTLTATEIKVQSSTSGSTGSHDDDNEDDDANDDKKDGNQSGNQSELTGTVASIVSRSCPGAMSFTIGTVTVTTNSQTEFDNTSCATLAATNKVEVKGTKPTSTTMLASKVEKK